MRPSSLRNIMAGAVKQRKNKQKERQNSLHRRTPEYLKLKQRLSFGSRWSCGKRSGVSAAVRTSTSQAEARPCLALPPCSQGSNPFPEMPSCKNGDHSAGGLASFSNPPLRDTVTRPPPGTAPLPASLAPRDESSRPWPGQL